MNDDRKQTPAPESEEILRTIFDSMPGFLFFKDTENRLVRANKTLCEALGKPEEELIGVPLAELLPDHSEQYWRDDLEVIAGGVPKLGIVEALTTPSGTVWVRTDKIPYRDTSGEIIGIIGFSVDITDQQETEESLRIARFEVENAGDMIMRIAKDGQILDVNDSACVLYGYACSDLAPLRIWDINPGISAEDWKEIWSWGKEEEHAQFETTGLRKDGSTFPVEMALSFLEFEGSEYIVLFGRDISERRKADDRLREAERRYRELAESLPQVVFELDARGMVTYVNQNALDMFGYTPQDVAAGLHALDIIEPVDHARVSGAIDKMMDGRSTGAIREYLARRKDGSTFPAIVYSTLVSDEGGAPLGIRGLLTDISERTRYEEELRRANEELQGFAQTVSHDLRSPLAAILIAAEIVDHYKDHPDDDRAADAMAEAATVIFEKVDSARRLIDDLLLLAAAGHESPEVKEVDVRDVVEAVLEENSIDLAGLGFATRVDDDLGTVTASPTHVYQVFANLIRNAVRHGAGDEPVVEVRRLGSTEGMGRYLVKDNGPGIPARDLERVFLAFHRGESGGPGLGLTIVERIVRNYGGEIKAYNDGGACFEFTLPD